MTEDLFNGILSDDPILRALDNKARQSRLKKMTSEQIKRDAVQQFEDWCKEHKYHIKYIFTLLKKWLEVAEDYTAICTFLRTYNFTQCGSRFHALARSVDDNNLYAYMYGILDEGQAVTLEYDRDYSPSISSLFDPYKYSVLTDEIFEDEKWDGPEVKKQLECMESDFTKMGEEIKKYLIKELNIEELAI